MLTPKVSQVSAGTSHPIKPATCTYAAAHPTASNSRRQ